MKPQYFLPFGATLMIAATIGLSGCAAPRTPYDAKLIPSYSSEAVRYGNVSAIDLEFYDWPPKGETTRSGVVSDAVAMGSVGNSMGYTGAGLLWGAASGGLIAAANAPQRYPIAVFKVTVGDQEIVVRERMNRSEYRFAIGERVAVGNFSTKPFLAKEAEGQRLY